MLLDLIGLVLAAAVLAAVVVLARRVERLESRVMDVAARVGELEEEASRRLGEVREAAAAASEASSKAAAACTELLQRRRRSKG